MKRSRDDRDQTGSDRVTGSASMNVPGANRGWRVIHQSLVIWNLNMRTKSLMAFVDFKIRCVMFAYALRCSDRSGSIFSYLF